MKVAFVVGQFPLLSEAFILNQISAVLDRGHEVSIYSIQGKPDHLSKVHPIVEKYNLFEKTYFATPVPKNFLLRLTTAIKLLIQGNHFFSFRWLKLINVFVYGRQAFSLRLLYYGMPFLNVQSYDIIHAQFGSLGKFSLSFKDMRLIDGKLITHFRGHDISVGLGKGSNRIYNDLFDRGDFFLTNCEFFRKRILELGCPIWKIRVHGSAIDCNKFQFKERQKPLDNLRIVTVGRLTEKKGIEYCIRAISKLVKSDFEVKYTIIGEGELREKFEHLISELGINNFVRLVGSKSQQEIINILDNCHIFIAPSVTAKNGDQDAPVNTLKEAMSMGLPVISTWHGGIPELVDDGISGYLVPERDSDAIAQKISDLTQQSNRWSEMGRAGSQKVKSMYDINVLGDELISIYQDLLESEDSNQNKFDLSHE